MIQAKLGITNPVDTQIDCASTMSLVIMGNDKVRLCINPKPRNKALNRTSFPIPTIEDLLPKLSKARTFTVADAKNGFLHIKLDKESSHLTTCDTPWGNKRLMKLPFGVSPAPEEF